MLLNWFTAASAFTRVFAVLGSRNFFYTDEE